MIPEHFSCKFIVTLVLCAAAVKCEIHSFPNTVPRCKFGDVKCLQNIMNEVIKSSPGGIAEIGLGSIDPLIIGKTAMEQGAPNSPVNIKIRMKNTLMTGIKDFVVTKVVGFGRNPNTTRFEIHGFCPKVTVSGNYQMSGKALIVPVNGHGLANITLYDSDVKMKLLTHTEYRNDAEYVVLDNILYNCKAKRMSTNFDNLFNDRLISENMNNFFNQNQEILYKELGPSMSETFGNVIKKKLEPLFKKFPYQEFFLD